MKQFQLLFGILTLVLMSSCSFTEEITINPDGSGEFIMSYDMTTMLNTLEESQGKEKDPNKKMDAPVDSVLYYNDLIIGKQDSISKLPQEEQDKIKKLKDIIIKIKMNEATNEMIMGFGSTFTTIEDLPNALERINSAKDISNKDNPQYDKMNESAIAKSSEGALEHVTFTYKNNTFSRIYTAPENDEEKEKTTTDIEDVNAEISEMGDAFKEAFDLMSYNIVYHFPKKIKSTNHKDAVISEDGKTLTLKLKFLDLIEKPEISSLNVILEE
jgi:hypothetical protein